MKVFFLMTFTLFFASEAYASCKAIRFNGSSKKTCDGGFNHAEYERDIIKMSTSSPCEDTTLLSTDGGFHCIPQEEIPKNLDVKSATAMAYKGFN